MRKKASPVVLLLAIAALVVGVSWSAAGADQAPEAPPAASATRAPETGGPGPVSVAEGRAPAGPETEPSPGAASCVSCHKEQTPGIYGQWSLSAHARNEVGCLDCHGAAEGEPDAFEHEGRSIATLVTPKDCGSCHEEEAREVDASYHATAGLILESQDAYLAHAVGGHPAAVAGCENCHGTKIRIDPTAPNRLDPVSWPNGGIGRLNPDGSKGSCTACHARHRFSIAQARRPEACAKCHLGPDHPQKEVYDESKHGGAFYAGVAEMNLDAERWVVGVDYAVAPTCATCHMSATRRQPVTHDVGRRISWTLRPPVSALKEGWAERRASMQDVCGACHGQRWIDGHYRQFDGVVHLYDEKFAKPAGELMALVKKRGLLQNPAAFSNEIEWAYWELWHHEGRRARHGAAMMGPDYTWWHGIYEVAHRFYFELLPAARELHDPEVTAFVESILPRPDHAWFRRPTEEIKKDIREGRLQQLYRDFFQTVR